MTTTKYKRAKQTTILLAFGETNQAANRPPSIYVRRGDAVDLDDTFHLLFYSLLRPVPFAFMMRFVVAAVVSW